MKTKEAIEFICNLAVNSYKSKVYDIEEEHRKIAEIKELLKQGEKYKKIVNELSEILPKPHYVYTNCRGKKFEYRCNDNAIEILNDIRQKHFPKGENKCLKK